MEYDLSAAVEDEGRGQALLAERVGELEVLVDELGVTESVPLDELADPGGGLAHGHADDDGLRPGGALVEAVQGGHLALAGVAPGGPEGDERDAAGADGVHGFRRAVEIQEGDGRKVAVGRGGPEEGCSDRGSRGRGSGAGGGEEGGQREKATSHVYTMTSRPFVRM